MELTPKNINDNGKEHEDKVSSIKARRAAANRAYYAKQKKRKADMNIQATAALQIQEPLYRFEGSDMTENRTPIMSHTPRPFDTPERTREVAEDLQYSNQTMNDKRAKRSAVNRANYAKKQNANPIRRETVYIYNTPNRQRHINKRFVSLQQEWDDENPCKTCQCVFLKSESKRQRIKCCLRGLMFNDDFRLKHVPLPDYYVEGLRMQTSHLSRVSAKYNGVFSLCATGVDNGKKSGFEKIVGSHAVKMNGRTYHYLPTSKSKGGIHHFILDSFSSAKTHAEEMNHDDEDFNMKEDVLRMFYDGLREHNSFVQDCVLIGAMATEFSDIFIEDVDEEIQFVNSNLPPDTIAFMNTQVHSLDVSAVTNNFIDGNRVIRFKLKDNARSWKEISIPHPDVEPMTYPLLFPRGESGWSTSDRRYLDFKTYMCSRMLMPDIELGTFLVKQARCCMSIECISWRDLLNIG